MATFDPQPQDQEKMNGTIRPVMDVDIACVGFGPAMGGFLTRMQKELSGKDNDPLLMSTAMPGMPLQIIAYERADDIGSGVSGVVSRAKGLKESFPELESLGIPMATRIKEEKLLYLLDPIGPSRRSALFKTADRIIRTIGRLLPFADEALTLPYIPPFLHKRGGMILSIGQFNQWIGANLMAGGQIQIWPGMPVAGPLIDKETVQGIRLVDQGVDKEGNPSDGYSPGMDIRARLTVIGDGPLGPIGRAIDERFGVPKDHHTFEWAVGMKVVIDLPSGCRLKEGTVYHTFGYPEPEIFGFLYVHPGGVASAGIFVPSFLFSPIRTTYRYLQHWLLHPAIFQHIGGGTMRSWGAKSILESGKQGEPFLAGNGYARIGEGSGTTNVLTGSGVDEAWTSGVLLAEATIELLNTGRSFSKENLDATYGKKRRESWLDKEAEIARSSRNGFSRNMFQGLLGMALAGMSKGVIAFKGKHLPSGERLPTLESYFAGRIGSDEIERIRVECQSSGKPLHEALLTKAGWPEVPYDGKLLVSLQDALLIGGKVQAAPGFSDHVRFLSPDLCRQCRIKTCISNCSGQAITANSTTGLPEFDREKCVHCGACLWNCSRTLSKDPLKTNVAFQAGSGGFHSAEN